MKASYLFLLALLGSVLISTTAQSSDGTGASNSGGDGALTGSLTGSVNGSTASVNGTDDTPPWYSQTYSYTYGYTPYQIAVAVMGAVIVLLGTYGGVKALGCCRQTVTGVSQAEQDAEAGAVAIQSMRNGASALSTVVTSGGGGTSGATAV